MVIWQEKMEALARKHYTPAQRERLGARMNSFSEFERSRIALAQILNDVRALGANPDARSTQAQAIARRARDYLNDAAGGDASMVRAMAALNREVSQDPDLVRQMPGQEHWPFIDQAMRAAKLID